MTPARGLRELIQAPGMIVVPGAATTLMAKLVAQSGFAAVYVSGAGFTNSYLGMPDVGLITLTELADQVENIRNVVELPLIVDADTGFGGWPNVRRTVQLLERRGANAIQLEDQVFPKRCGHFAGTEVIPAAEMIVKIHAAVDARQSEDTLIMARTDARASLGLDTAIERANAYREAGADLLFVEAPASRDELARVAREVDGPRVANMVEGGRTPIVEADELAAIGFSLAIYANAALRAGIRASRRLLGVLRETGSTTAFIDELLTWDERQELVGKPAFDALDAKYTDVLTHHERSGVARGYSG